MKREIIKSNLYGIDIETEAIEIAKLRLWLSLVVDEELNKVEPLPNLDYKLAVGNSLTETLKGKRIIEPKEYQNSLYESETQKLTNEFVKLKKQLTDEMDVKKKSEIRKKLENVEWRLIEQGLTAEIDTKMQQALNLSNRYNIARIEIPSSERKKISKLMDDVNKTKSHLKKQKTSKPFFLPPVHFVEVFANRRI